MSVNNCYIFDWRSIFYLFKCWMCYSKLLFYSR